MRIRDANLSRIEQPQSRGFRLSLVLAFLSVLATLAEFSHIAHAAGEQFTLSEHDLQIDVDSRWVGCSRGGYCPVRVRVTNRSLTRTLTFRIMRFGGGQSLPTVKQTLEVPQNGTLSLTLAVPMVNDTTTGEFRVEHNGAPLERMKHTVTFPDSAPYERSRTAMIVVAPGVVDTQAFEDGVSTFQHAGGAIAAGRHFGSRSPGSLVLPPSSLPSSWIDYSGVDLVAITQDSLAKLPRVTRTALTQWTRCGGTLLVTTMGDMTKEQPALQTLLAPEGASASFSEWRDANVSERNASQIVSIDTSGGVASMSPPQGLLGEWSRESAPFRVSEMGFGKVVAFSQNPFPGTAHDWFWLLKATGGERQWNWVQRNGVSARGHNPDFLQFLIPGLRGVPVIMFLVLITLFSVIIGPVNYLVLAKRRQLHLLILSIPAIALVTSLFLFGYAVVAHGFGIKVRSRSLTLIDQSSQSAVTLNRLSMYAGQAPSAGLRFSRDTAIYPIWPEGERFEGGQVDWSDTQALTSGWLRSRTRTQFLTVRHRTERGRLEITPNAATQVSVANGFEWGFEHLVVQDEKGQLFVGSDIPAGATASLNLLSGEGHFKAVSEAMQRFPMEMPDGVTGLNRNDFLWGGHPYRSRHYYYSGGGGPETPAASASQLELTWAQLRNINQSPIAGEKPKRIYFGLASQTPNVELGVTKANEVAGSHVVMGRW